jgi:tetratricopeptide (TPR) repeat protein
MDEKKAFDQHGSNIHGPQTNIGLDVQAPVLSGEFHGNVIINEQPPAPKIIPLQKPLRVPHFTGREKELEDLLIDLQPGQAITICGPGGMGKTALAAEAIWQLSPGNAPPERFPDGIIFHTFYHKPQADLALEAIARAYDVDPRPSPLEAARQALNGRQALIVLDGTEAADDLTEVLSICGNCAVLITTRRHSDAPADFSDLPPLPLPKATLLLQSWAAGMARDNTACQRICNLLGCLPLGIFLAGRYMAQRRQTSSEYLAWMEKTPLDALDLGEKQHQSIPLLMKHSLAQVSPLSQECLGITGVLALKPFEPGMIAYALKISAEDTRDALGELVDYGLLIRPDALYQATHALAHTYARTEMTLNSEALSRLAEHFEAFISKQNDLGLSGYALLDSQLDHILAIQSACNNASKWDLVRRLTWALDNYLDLQGHWAERCKSAEVGLLGARSSKNRYDEGSFLILLGLAYTALGEARKAIEYYEKALAVAREIGDKSGQGNALGNLGIAYKNLGEARKAIEYYEKALAVAREIGDKSGQGNALGNLGIAYKNLGEARKAIENYEKALTIAREIGDKRNEGNWLGNLGIAYKNLGEAGKAIEYYEKALAIARNIGDKRGEGIHLGNLGNAYVALGEAGKAFEYYEKALAIARDIGDKRAEGNHLGNLGNAYAALGEAGKAIEYYHQQLAIAQEIGDRRGEGNALWNMSRALNTLGEREKAIISAKAALTIYEQIASPAAAKVRRRLDDWSQKDG